MLKRTNLILLVVLTLAAGLSAVARPSGASSLSRGFRHGFGSHVVSANDREQDGLAGPVRRVKTETAKMTSKSGKVTEGPRVVLETAAYDVKGVKIDNAYFLTAAGASLTGKESYKYDAKGNMVEMTLHDESGTLISKEVYSYDFDGFGNWTKMVTSVAVVEGGKLTFEATEVAYRTISYFLDEASLAKMNQPDAAPASTTTPATNASAQPAATTPATASAAPAPSAQPSAANKQPAASANVAASKQMVAPAAMPQMSALDKSKVYGISNPSMQNASGAGGASAPVVKDESEAPAMARPVMRGPVKPISGGVLNGKATHMPAPMYPDMAKRVRATGMVTVEVVIDMSGKVISARATSGPSMLQQAAESAARQARFSPTLLSGQPVRVSGIINYNFQLAQ